MTIATLLLDAAGTSCRMIDLASLKPDRLPLVHRILLENALRHGDAPPPDALADWLATGQSDVELAFRPGRVLMHDTTCGPALADLAAARSAVAEAGGDPALVNPMLPVDVSTDHSIAVDVHGTRGAMAANMAREIERNAERYRFMRWANQVFSDFTVHPPGTGIMHTINLERLASVVTTTEIDGERWAVPDTLIGTDSHTPMINGIGVLAWGVGGLEAESVMLGMPVMLRVPEVVGVKLTGAMPEGVTAADLALRVTHELRKIALAGRFVEFFGAGVATLSAGDRAAVANMAPEYGSSTGYFPIDEATLRYLRQTGRPAEQVALVERYARAAGLWFDPAAEPAYHQVITLDLATIALALSGPRRPQDLLPVSGARAALGDGRTQVALAAITSCTNTSDPRQLIAAGLVARKARAMGLRTPAWVKTVLAPGSPTAERMLARSGLLEDLEALGFAIAGYGCTVCIGNSGPLTDATNAAIAEGVTPVAILSGNRNFPGRVHASIEHAFLASPPLVVAYALAGDAAIDIGGDAIGTGADGQPVRLAQLWPSGAEIDAIAAASVLPQDFAQAYAAAEANPAWAALAASSEPLHDWDPRSTYLRRPPFAAIEAESRLGSYAAAPLIVLGDDITTDHISPAGAIPRDSDAGRWLIERGENPLDLNVYSSRRGNWEVMLRGLFTNRSVRNLLAPDLPAGQTMHAGSGEAMPLWQASARYASEGVPVVIVAGERYGMGSSRDWAAKGASLLGVRAVIASSFERIHRSNLVNMGILPLRLPEGVQPVDLDLTADDRLLVEADADRIAIRGQVPVTIVRADGTRQVITAHVEVETALELATLRAGGMIPMVLQRRLSQAAAAQQL